MKTKKRSEILRAKRAKAREAARKLKEERRRAREVKEEKWTIKNEHLLIAEHRRILRKSNVDVIREECHQLLDVVLADQNAKSRRIALLKSEVDQEIGDMHNFIDETCAYYDEIHQQISPPEEKSVDNIVADIERKLREMFDVFHSAFDFDPVLPDAVKMDSNVAEKDAAFVKDIEQLEREIETNKTKSEALVKEISAVKTSIELENVRFAAIKKEKSTDQMLKAKKIARMEEKLRFVGEDPIERGEIIKISNKINSTSREKQRIERMIQQLSEILKK